MADHAPLAPPLALILIRLVLSPFGRHNFYGVDI